MNLKVYPDEHVNSNKTWPSLLRAHCNGEPRRTTRSRSKSPWKKYVYFGNYLNVSYMSSKWVNACFMSSQNSLLLAHAHLKEFILSDTVVFQLDFGKSTTYKYIYIYLFKSLYIYVYICTYSYMLNTYEHIIRLEASKWLYLDFPWKKACNQISSEGFSEGKAKQLVATPRSGVQLDTWAKTNESPYLDSSKCHCSPKKWLPIL